MAPATVRRGRWHDLVWHTRSGHILHRRSCYLGGGPQHACSEVASQGQALPYLVVVSLWTATLDQPGAGGYAALGHPRLVVWPFPGIPPHRYGRTPDVLGYATSVVEVVRLVECTTISVNVELATLAIATHSQCVACVKQYA